MNPAVPILKGRKCADFAHLRPFFVFLFVKYLCLPERRLVIGYIYEKEDCDCRFCLYCRRGKCGAVRCCWSEEKIRTRSPVLHENDEEKPCAYFPGQNPRG